jgi:hypothetical protein
MLKDYDYSPLHYRLMHAMVQPALGPECVTVAGVRRVCPSPQIFSKMRIGRSIHPLYRTLCHVWAKLCTQL